jgi:hypothetical protein
MSRQPATAILLVATAGICQANISKDVRFGLRFNFLAMELYERHSYFFGAKHIG